MEISMGEQPGVNTGHFIYFILLQYSSVLLLVR
jgi:hypothetical protein